ncbi:TetR/AcrR family transcriptional regulator [Nocardiopsis sp. RSe5-2]|uniref:TetR/AcrR family transcriptional regulator n=1 Tax=Nocardiopsis endophytica TaxID=3018445 RepID=A0ABT4UCU3_9ACTN|nr:TetR/AcrR family transcriptional regulator [Nocardiopsis endophytica]MDA2814781.1 TetR/AcrR family transcriptional regulator [Nocardiopsis endophytica]
MAAADEREPEAAEPGDFLWERPVHPPRAGGPGLTRAAITAAAVALADEHGPDEVTMRRVAKAVGSGTMSLYRHVRTKEELLDLMADAVVGEAGGAPLPGGGWRGALEEMARRERAVYLRHPWAPRVLAGRPLIGPNALAATERWLEALDGHGVSARDALRVVGTVTSFVRGFAQTEIDEAAWRRPDAEGAGWSASALPYLRRVLDGGRSPRFAATAGAAPRHPDRDEDFAWQLGRVLDGLAAAVEGGDEPGAPRA